MASIIKFQSMTGAEGEVPHCYLLEIDDTTLLLDAGWDVNFTMSYLDAVRRRVDEIDAVLLSFPDLSHAGALPYLFGKCGLSCPVYATVPVYKMGQMFLYDQCQSRHNSEEFDVYSLDDVDAAFDRVVQLKYHQTVTVGRGGVSVSVGGGGDSGGCSITPLPAGHMIGGTVWRISRSEHDQFLPHLQQQQHQEDIIYGIDMNHKKERHLHGCQLEGVSVQRPAVFITDAFNLLRRQTRRRARDEHLVTAILQTLRGGGNVLVSVDTAGRVLELVLMLEQLWHSRDSGLQAYRLLLLNNVCYNVIEFAKSQIEWMSERLARGFESARANPFQLRHVQLCHSVEEVHAGAGPCVVLATCASLQCGFARDLFVEWCGSASNHIVLTSSPSAGTLAHELLGVGSASGRRSVSLQVRKRVRLEGAELQEFRRREARAARAKAALLAGEDSSDSDAGPADIGVIDLDVMSDDGRPQTTATGGVTSSDPSGASGGGGDGSGRHDLLMPGGAPNPLFYGHSSRRRHPMFPHREHRRRHDEYGQPVPADQFSRLLAASTASGGDEEELPEDAGLAADTSIHVEGSETIAEENVPSKCLSYYRTFTVAATVSLIDFEGRIDGESMLRILEQIRPRRLILTRAPEHALKSLTIKLSQVAERVMLAHPGLHLDATSASHIYRLRLRHSLVTSLQFARGRSAQLAWLDGVVATPTETVDALDSEQQQQQQYQIPYLEPVPADEPPLPHPTVFVNDLRLSDFKQILMKNEIQSEFSDGVLWCCEGTVALRRQEQGNMITVEGCLSEDYFRVRSLLYEQYAIV